jgi:branched-chain amino acid transport system permease protein
MRFLPLVLTLALGAVAQDRAMRDAPIVLGAIIEVTGKSALAGQQERRGIEMALEEMNGAGGLRTASGRRPVEVTIEDNASQNAGSINALNKLAGRGDVVAMLGPIRSTQVLAILARINEVGIPVLTGATNETITKQGSRWIFRVRTDDGLAARLAARHAVDEMGARRIAILHGSDAFGTGGLTAFTVALRQMYGIEPVIVEQFHAGDRDFTGQLLAVRNASADLLVAYSTSENEAGLILRRYSQLGLRYKFLGSPAFGTSIVMAVAGGESEGVHVFTDFSPERPGAATQDFRGRYRQRYNEDPDLLVTQAYDAFRILGEAIERGGKEPEKLRRALMGMRHAGAAGEFHFDAEGNGRHDMNIVTIHEGRHKVLETLDAASLANVARLPPGSVRLPGSTARLLTAMQLLAEGVALGSVYALVALGFVLLYNCASLVNFAQGDLVMVGGYLLAMFAPRFGPWPALGLVIVAMAAFSIVFRRITYDPIAEQAARDFTPFVVTTIGASIFLKNAARLIWGAQPALPESPFGRGSTEIAGVFVPYHEAGIVAVTIAVLALLYFVFQKTMLGVRLRAVAQDRETAALMGIPVRTMIAAAFAGGCMLAGIGGALLAPVYFVQPEMGGMFSLKAFAASIVGGFGSLPGAIAGGVILGVVETLTGAYLSQAFRDGIAFVLIIGVLIFRPSGLFGEKSGDRG